MRINLGTNSALSWVLTLAGTIGFSSFAVAGPMPDCGSGAGNIKDEAMCVGRGPDSLPGSEAIHLPLATDQSVLGVLVVKFLDKTLPLAQRD